MRISLSCLVSLNSDFEKYSLGLAVTSAQRITVRESAEQTTTTTKGMRLHDYVSSQLD